jgi:hypothetical protein
MENLIFPWGGEGNGALKNAIPNPFDRHICTGKRITRGEALIAMTAQGKG